MHPPQHSHIRHSSENQSSSHSDLQSLNNLRDLLPPHQPISAIDNYLIYASQMTEQLAESGVSEEEGELMFKIAEQTHHILKMQEQLYYFRSEFFKIAQENQQHIETIKQLQELECKLMELTHEQEDKLQEQSKRREEVQAANKLKETEIETLKQEISALKQTKADSHQHLYQKMHQQLRFQERVILQLSVKNENILKINLFLKEELRIAQNKLIQLQIEMQERFFGGLSENLIRLKQNHNLINKKTHGKLQAKPQPKQSQLFQLKFLPPDHEDTIKLTSRRESVIRDDRCHREVKTLEKERDGFSPRLIERLRPLPQSKPQKKNYKAVDIEPVSRFKTNMSTQQFFS